MKFFNLSLSYRLLLATIPGFVILLALVAEVLIDGWYLRIEDRILLRWIAFAALFGVFVMAPFITSPSRLILRIGVLIAASILMPFAAILSAIWLNKSAFAPPLGSGYFEPAFCIILTAHLFAAVLVIAAPLKVSRKYWIYVALAALVTTAVVFGSSRYFCFAFWYMDGWSLICPWWWELAFVIPPSVVGPLSFCTAVYFGRIDNKRVDQIATESGRE